MTDPVIAEQAAINADVGQSDLPDEAADEQIDEQETVNLAADSSDTAAVDARFE